MNCIFESDSFTRTQNYVNLWRNYLLITDICCMFSLLSALSRYKLHISDAHSSHQIFNFGNINIRWHLLYSYNDGIYSPGRLLGSCYSVLSWSSSMYVCIYVWIWPKKPIDRSCAIKVDNFSSRRPTTYSDDFQRNKTIIESPAAQHEWSGCYWWINYIYSAFSLAICYWLALLPTTSPFWGPFNNL